MPYFVVLREPGPAWVRTRPLREQPGWTEHAKFMNALAGEGWIHLGGPIGDGTRSLLIVLARDEAAVRDRLSADPWAAARRLRTSMVEPWEILLGTPSTDPLRRDVPSSTVPRAAHADRASADDRSRERPTVGSPRLFVFARFHSREGHEGNVAQVLREVRAATREEPGCLSHEVFRSTRDSRLFWVHSRWVDSAAFDRHAELPHTLRFLQRIEPLIDHPLDVSRSLEVG